MIHADIGDIIEFTEDAHLRKFSDASEENKAKHRFAILQRTIEITHHIAQIFQMSIFSELNNINNISMRNDYAGICGITKEELETQMSADVDALAVKMNLTRTQTLDALREFYDGYHFAAQSPDIFNPYSLLNAMAKSKLDYYWFTSGTPTYLIEMLKKFQVMPSEIGSCEADKSDFDAPTEMGETSPHESHAETRAGSDKRRNQKYVGGGHRRKNHKQPAL